MELIVFCPNWVGDAVMATPTLRALRQRFPEARMTGLMKPVIAATLEGNPWFDDVLLHDPKSKDRSQRTLATTLELRRRQPALGVLLTNSLRSAFLAWAGGIRRRVGYDREYRGLLLNDRLKPLRDRNGFTPSPVIDYYLKLAERLGAPPESPRMELFTTSADERAAETVLAKFGITPGERFAAINPGAAFGAAKRWPSKSFAELTRRLVDEEGLKAVILCGPSEKGFARFIADGSFRPRQVKSLANEEVSLGLSKALVRRASLLVSTDSGPRHFGAALGVPTVALFGPTHIEWTDTHFERELHVQHKVPCGPCQQRECPLGHHQCMNDLGVDRVFDACARLLRGGVRKAA